MIMHQMVVTLIVDFIIKQWRSPREHFLDRREQKI